MADRLEDVARRLRGGEIDEATARDEAAAPDPTAVAPPEERAFVTLAELLAQPELLKAPEPVVPLLAYRGRTVILAATDKSGKSTLAGDAIACVSSGDPFLGLTTPRGRALLVGLEEHVGDAVARFTRLDPTPDRIVMLKHAPGNLVEQVVEELGTASFDLVVVDSLQEYARVAHGQAPDDGDNAAWATVVRPLVALSRRYEVAILILHHARRSDGKARGATEIFAAVDATLEMERVPGDSRARKISGRARWDVDDVVVRLGANGRYELAHGPDDGPITAPEIDDMILDYVATHPGASKSAVREGVPRKAAEVDRALRRLAAAGRIRNRGSETRHEWHASETDLGLLP